MKLPRIAIPVCLATVFLLQTGFGQDVWKTVTNLPGIDWKNLTGARQQSALRIMQAEACTCGCSFKIAECRVKDTPCTVSRKLGNTVVNDSVAGKDAAAVKAHLKAAANEPAPVLEDAVKINAGAAPVRGPNNARVTLVEFSDFQCPYCSQVVPRVKDLLKQFPKDVRMIFKQFPLDSHSDAEFAAEASLAAQAQGKFWEMHDLLYAGFPDVGRRKIMIYAKQLNLDLNRFTAELDAHKYRPRVAAESKEGEDAGVSGTPTFYLNGRKFNGSFDVATLAPLIRKELK